VHDWRVVTSQPGLYFVGLFFLCAGTSAVLRGVGRVAKRIVGVIGSDKTETAP
jgi:putative flavoprotein involved in K+ transport